MIRVTGEYRFRFVGCRVCYSVPRSKHHREYTPKKSTLQSVVPMSLALLLKGRSGVALTQLRRSRGDQLTPPLTLCS